MRSRDSKYCLCLPWKETPFVGLLLWHTVGGGLIACVYWTPAAVFLNILCCSNQGFHKLLLFAANPFKYDILNSAILEKGIHPIFVAVWCIWLIPVGCFGVLFHSVMASILHASTTIVNGMGARKCKVTGGPHSWTVVEFSMSNKSIKKCTECGYWEELDV
eukprot:g44847.t1